MSFLRRTPAALRERLLRGERLLVSAPSGEGHLAATDQALLLPDGGRVPYEEIEKASWDQRGLTVIRADGTTVRVAVTEPGRVPEALRERVNSTIVVNKHVNLPGVDGGVRLVARRKPGGDVLGWTFVFDEGLDPADPGLRAQAEQALEGVRRSMGV
ncbi:hypothetical protein ACIBH1_06585 [Nonomuraea sp. NPDC050663]|uniref:hypothetical protein n=1 Tax=Nonomuraea sp. NPDC050663 TaxID=3364370 RepID=UPI0037B78D47